MLAQIEKWNFFEYSLPHQGPGNPFLDVSLEATFIHPNSQVQVSGFYDGNGVFKVRFMPGHEGVWRFVTRSNFPALDGQQGEFLCGAPSANNHGPVRVFNTLNFAYEDGTPYTIIASNFFVGNHQFLPISARLKPLLMA